MEDYLIQNRLDQKVITTIQALIRLENFSHKLGQCISSNEFVIS